MYHTRVSTTHTLRHRTARYTARYCVRSDRNHDRHSRQHSKKIARAHQHARNTPPTCSNVTQHSYRARARAANRRPLTLDSPHSAERCRRAFRSKYSSPTRATRLVVMCVMCLTNEKSNAPIDFPLPSRVGRAATSAGSCACFNSRSRRSMRTRQLTRAHDVPHSCEYNARVATRHSTICYETLREK